MKCSFTFSELSKVSGIYSIRTSVNNRIYVGSSINLWKRYKQHKNDLKTSIHHNVKLQRHVHKFGIDSLLFEIIEFCDKEILIEREQYWIDYHKAYDILTGFNINLKAESSIGVKRSDEYKKNVSIRVTGTKWSKENKRNLQLSRLGNPGNVLPVLQYTLDGEFVREWASTRSAYKSFGKNKSSCIANNLSGMSLSAHGYFWTSKNKPFINLIRYYMDNPYSALTTLRSFFQNLN